MRETAYRIVLVCDEAAQHSNLCFLGIEFLFDDDENRLGKEVGRHREIEALKTVTIAISRFNSLSSNYATPLLAERVQIKCVVLS